MCEVFIFYQSNHALLGVLIQINNRRGERKSYTVLILWNYLTLFHVLLSSTLDIPRHV